MRVYWHCPILILHMLDNFTRYYHTPIAGCDHIHLVSGSSTRVDNRYDHIWSRTQFYLLFFHQTEAR